VLRLRILSVAAGSASKLEDGPRRRVLVCTIWRDVWVVAMADQQKFGAAHPRTSIFADLKDISSKFGMLAAIIAILTTGFSGYVTSLLQPYYSAGQIVVLNVPMVASATVLAMLFNRCAHAHTTFWRGLWIVVAAIVIPYVIAWLFGLAGAVNPSLSTIKGGCSLGRDCLEPGPLARDPGPGALLQYLHPARAVSLAIGILLHYSSPHRLPNTLSALASGIFLAWMFETKLLPRTRRLTQQERPSQAS
jgi:hypothetical protein